MKISFDNFFSDLLIKSGIKNDKELSIKELREIISKINEYFYTTYSGIGQTFALDDTFEYFSEFHKFWEQNHEKILNPEIDEEKCNKIAKILNGIYLKNGKNIFYDLYNTYTLKPHEICKIRYFAA